MNKPACTTTINRCPMCRIIVTPSGFRWSCDDYQPEVIALLEAREQEDEDEQFCAASLDQDEQIAPDRKQCS